MSLKLEGIHYIYGQGTEMVVHALNDINIENNNRSEFRNIASKNNVKNLLLLAFIFSILSLFFALIIVSISMNSSPLPSFPFSMTEHMWKFYLFLPLPLASLILGVIYIGQGYKCKKILLQELFVQYY